MDEERASAGWLVCIALAATVHAAAIVPLVAGREGPDIASAGDGPGATEAVVVVDTSLIGGPGAVVPEAAAQQAARNAPPASGPGRGATLLPFDMLPIPSPEPPPATKPKPQKIGTAATASKPTTYAPRPVARPVPDEPQPFDVAAMPPDPPPAYFYPPPPPPPPPPPQPSARRSARAFWWGVWCGVYVRCD